MTRRALLLTPSYGRGGGIERYAETLEWAFKQEGVACRRFDLACPGPQAHRRILADALAYLRQLTDSTRIIVAHRALLPVAWILGRQDNVSGISVICHGSDVWGRRLQARGYLERKLMQRQIVRVVAVSSFTSGVLLRNKAATVLPPGLSRGWYDTLVGVSKTPKSPRSDFQLATAFRLSDWRDKGLPQILMAIKKLDRTDIHFNICGSGEAPSEMLEFVQSYQGCDVFAGLSDSELARQLALADVFILATRTRSGKRPSGEGFGLVLLEAQLAGTPVVAPAFGGSHDAYIEGITGVAPLNESAEALADLLASLLDDSERLAGMSQSASAWSRERFQPEKYAAMAVARLL